MNFGKAIVKNGINESPFEAVTETDQNGFPPDHPPIYRHYSLAGCRADSFHADGLDTPRTMHMREITSAK